MINYQNWMVPNLSVEYVGNHFPEKEILCFIRASTPERSPLTVISVKSPLEIKVT